MSGRGGVAAWLADGPDRYGLVSRAFHWVMAYLLLWQFLTLLGWRLLGDGAVMRTASLLGPAHGTVGVLVIGLVVPRAAWAGWNRRRRPAADSTLAGWLARGVHALFYLLMAVVPALALARAYGSGKGYALWGLQVMPATGREVGWLVAPADLLHKPLAWTLAVLVAGHIAMALLHGLVRRDGVLARMAGPMGR